MLVSEINIQKKLIDFGFTSISNRPSIIFAKSLDKVFFGFGEIIQKGLIEEAKKQKLSINFTFPYYSMVEQTIVNFLGEQAGKKMLDMINQELTKQTGLQGPSETILNELSRQEIFQQIDGLKGHEHIIYLWKKEINRDRVLTHFFKGSKGENCLISPKKSPWPNITNITYKEIFENNTDAVNKIERLIFRNDENSPSRIAGLDSSSWFDSGLGSKCIEIEKSFEEKIEKNHTSGICAYETKRIPDENALKGLIDCHQYVLLDDPFVLYQRGN